MEIIKKARLSDKTIVLRDRQEALDYLYYEENNSNRSASQPQLILLDLKLSKVNGLNVLKKIRSTKSTKDMPVVILTSSKLTKILKGVMEKELIAI
jgi:two-component system response regulator